MSSITLDGVGLRYPGGGAGLDGVDLAVADGEFLALVGPSGSGKTTLLRAIAGFIAPGAGSIRIDDEVVAGDGVFVQPEHRRLGMVFQQHAIWPHWDVARNVGYPLRMAGRGRRERARRVAEVLELVGLAGYEARDPATLSGGQRQRVALARALAGGPRVLLLDEALSALDEPLRNRLRGELRFLTRSIGLTVVHVTHDRDEALALADRVVVLDHGRVQQLGTSEELVQRPASPFVAAFLGDATVVEGSIEGGRFVTAEGRVPLPVEAWPDAASGEGTLAVLPEDVRLTAADGGPDAGVVTSSLFGRQASDVVVAWRGVSLRASVTGPRPLVGDRVGVRVARAVFYPNEGRPAVDSLGVLAEVR